MNVLHIYDCAGVAATLCHGLRNKGTLAMSVQSESADVFKFSEVYKEQFIAPKNSILELIELCGLIEIDFDIVHLHFFWGGLKMLREKFPKAKIVMHYHGSDVRSSNESDRISYEAFADGIIISTPDLSKYKFHPDKRRLYLPTPIDTDRYKKIKNQPSYSNLKFTILRGQHDKDKMLARLEELDIERVRILDREHDSRPHSEMMDFYKQYAVYVQMIYDRVINDWITSLSRTSLECLASGLHVITADGTVIKELPETHKLDNVTTKLMEFYDSL